MKKTHIISVLLLFLVVLLFPTPAFANSALREYYGATSSGAVLTGDCPIEVTSEKLTFNILDYPDKDDFSLSEYRSNVSAEYTFYNPSDYDVTMQLVFPFGLKPLYAKSEDSVKNTNGSVTVDGKNVDAVLRATLDAYYDFEVDDALAKLKDEVAEPYRYKYGMTVYKYVYKISVPGGYDDGVLARFDIDKDRVWCFDTDIYRSEYSSEVDRVYLQVLNDDEITFYSFGDSQTYLDGGVSFFVEKTSSARRSAVSIDFVEIDGCALQRLYKSEIALRDVALTYYDESDGISETDYLNAVTEKLDRDGISHYYGLKQFDILNDLLLWYQYDLTIGAKQSVTNRVVAPLYPTINFAYEPNKFEYTYLWSPAKKWASFANLDVEINAAVDCYLLDNYAYSGTFEKTQSGYKTHFDSLPDGELRFVLCPVESPKYIQTAGYYFWIIFAIVGFIFLISCVVTLVFAIVVPIAITKNHRRNKRLQTTGESGVNSQGEMK